ncbi:hypothetical protein ACFCYI_16665 [Streptomyces sp. NPDC056257]|uniref:hypothetical protein n=1 Tax=Streptomyces sp. NPDC056257 TaxID=3345765 RepID=UPI0035E31EC3
MTDHQSAEDGDTLPGGRTGRTGRTRRMAELAAVVSAATAVAALVLGLFGLIGAGGSTRTPDASGGSSSMPPAETPSATATETPTPAPTPTGSAGPGATPTPAPSPPPPLPPGWRRTDAAALTTSLALPDGWKLKEDDAQRANWISPDGRYVLGVKRDSTHGSTAQAASIGQLAWYRQSAQSKMYDLTAESRALDQRGRDAVRLDLDFRWEGERTPSRRIELFVAGERGQVYQLLADDLRPDQASALPELFETARAQLVVDTP